MANQRLASSGAAAEAIENSLGERVVIAVEVMAAIGFDHRHLVLLRQRRA
jgi:hypothetical protein